MLHRLLSETMRMMEAKSDHSSKWMDKMYWNHFRQARFLHRLPSRCRQQLALPGKFAEKLKKLLPETVVLKGPGGATWEVRLVAKNDTLIFTDGWEQFVNDHSLQEKDLLLFVYNFVDSQFDVLIFDSQSNCEKESSYFIQASGEGRDETEMRENRRRSTQWEEDIYWTHFRTVHFLQHISVDGLRQLALPEKFARKLKANLPEIVPLKGPSGSTWNVALSGHGSFIFSRGWQEFVNDHSLDEDDLLIFGYHVDSCFEILAFDPSSMCEKEATYFTKKCENGGGFSVHPDKRKMQERVPQSSQHARCNPSSNANRAECAIESISKRMRREAEIEQPSNPSGKSNGRLGSRIPSKHRRMSCRRQYVPKRRPATEEEQSMALQSAVAASTGNSFIVVMRPSFVYSHFRMVVPSSWWRLHVSKEVTEFVLCIKERSWRAKLYRDPHRNAGLLIGGWKDFALQNNLEEFDVCLFEPTSGTKENPVLLNVSIFRAAK